MTSSTWPGRLFSLAQGLEAASVLPVGTRVIAVYFSTRRASGSSAGEEEGEEKVLEGVGVVMVVGVDKVDKVVGVNDSKSIQVLKCRKHIVHGGPIFLGILQNHTSVIMYHTDK